MRRASSHTSSRCREEAGTSSNDPALIPVEGDAMAVEKKKRKTREKSTHNVGAVKSIMIALLHFHIYMNKEWAASMYTGRPKGLLPQQPSTKRPMGQGVKKQRKRKKTRLGEESGHLTQRPIGKRVVQ